MNLRTDGFVRNIHSRNLFDVIRADVVLARIEKEAGRCCGMHLNCIRRVCWAMRWIIWTPCR
jgi:hypothetical protein